MMHIVSVVEIVTALAMLVCMAGLAMRRDDSKSTRALLVTCCISILQLLVDAAAFNLNGPAVPEPLIYVLNTLSFTMGCVLGISFLWYCETFINERGSISKYACRIPMALYALNALYILFCIARGQVFMVEDGIAVITGGMPTISSIAFVLLLLYIFVIALTRWNQIGKKYVLLLGLFGFAPFAATVISTFGFNDYSPAAAAFSVMVICVLLQDEVTYENELSAIAKAEHDRKIVQMRLDTVAESIHGGFKIGKNDRQFSFIYVSDQLAEMMGYTVDEFLEASGGCMAGIVNLDDAHREVPPALEAIARGEMYTMNYRMRCKDGSWKNVEDRGRLVQNVDGDEEFWSFIVDKDDMVEKDNALEAAQRQLSIIQSLARTYNSIYYVDMRDCTFVELGANLKGLSGIIGSSGDAAESLERMFNHIVKPEYVQGMREFCNLDTLNERMKDKDWISKQFDGVVNGWAEGTFIAVERDDQGNLVHVIWSTKDVNDEKSRELAYQASLEDARDAANAANDAKTSFLFNMSHDIRTPMNAVIGFTNLLEKYQDDPVKRADYLRKAQSSSATLLSIINNVLEMARIEKGAIQVNEEAWQGGDLCRSLCDTYGTLMEEKGVKLEYEYDIQHKNVYCDPVKLREVFDNLLSNALKYTQPGGTVRMTLKELPCERTGYVYYCFTVEDSGVGMSDEFLPRLFEEFARESSSTENSIQGTGLGMPIVKRLVELMDGTIEVESTKGIGSKFIVTIPHRIADVAELMHAREEYDPSVFQGKRILLMEDNDLNAEIAMEILGEVGFEVVRASDGAEGLSMMDGAPAGTYDVVIMDIQMPKMNGYDATRAIRALDDSAKAAVPILAMTANAFEEDRRNALAAGMNGHLAKPIDVPELMRTLANVLV